MSYVTVDGDKKWTELLLNQGKRFKCVRLWSKKLKFRWKIKISKKCEEFSMYLGDWRQAMRYVSCLWSIQQFTNDSHANICLSCNRIAKFQCRYFVLAEYSNYNVIFFVYFSPFQILIFVILDKHLSYFFFRRMDHYARLTEILQFIHE